MDVRTILDTAWGIIPHFPCRSVRATHKFYTEDLHFESGGIDPEDASEPNMCSVAIGKPAIRGNIYLFRVAEGNELHPSTAMIALGTEAVDQYHDILQTEGRVKIVEQIEDRPWGYRQFAVEDIDGNKIQFFRFLEGGNPGPGDEAS